MKILSLFDGMSCGYLAMLLEGIPIDRYVACEIDKHAIKTSLHNFPGIEQRGDVFEADFAEFEGFDWLIGGSPCTYWSIAQKNNRETEASGLGWELFSQYVRALKEAKPKWFIYENNKSMSKAIRESITEAFGFEPICINSALVSAQNRQRLYWVGRRNEDGTYSRVDVPMPEDRGILLKDILEAEPVRIPEYGVEDKSRPISSSYAHKGSGEGSLAYDAFPDNPNKQVFDYASGAAEPIRVGCMPSPDGELRNSQAFRVYSTEGKSVNLTSGGGGAGGKTGLYAIQVEEPPRCGYATPIEWDEDGRPIKAVSCADGKVYTVYEVKDGKITIKGKEYPIKLVDGFYIIRKLTVGECMRLQTVPEWYEFPVSDSQAYKLLGNGWTIEVIRGLIRAVKNEGRME